MLCHPYKVTQLHVVVSPYLERIKKTGEVLTIQDWGLRNLAYPIKKLFKAQYVYLRFSSTQKDILEIQKLLRFHDLVLRFLIVKLKSSERPNSILVDDVLTMKLRENLKLEDANELTH